MRGLSSRTIELIGFAYKLLAVFHPMTLRQLHYTIFSAAEIDYQNDQRCYRRLRAMPPPTLEDGTARQSCGGRKPFTASRTSGSSINCARAYR